MIILARETQVVDGKELVEPATEWVMRNLTTAVALIEAEEKSQVGRRDLKRCPMCKAGDPRVSNPIWAEDNTDEFDTVEIECCCEHCGHQYYVVVDVKSRAREDISEEDRK